MLSNLCSPNSGSTNSVLNNSIPSHSPAAMQPLYLTEEEALGLLDLCLASGAIPDAARDQAILKLTDLVRGYISENIRTEALAVASLQEALVESRSHAAPTEVRRSFHTVAPALPLTSRFRRFSPPQPCPRPAG